MKRKLFLIISLIVIAGTALAFLLYRSLISEDPLPELVSEEGYIGSRSCRECHERFYELWSPSHHGKAMQPIVDVLQNEELELQQEVMKVGSLWYEVSMEEQKLFMYEKKSRDTKEILKSYEAIWALGGRNIYYFLTPFEGGRLQTMPLAYDKNRKEWYSNPQSAVRHFVDDFATNEEVDWTHSLYTFNTTCHSCHVSQLNKNYNSASNTYHTTWREPGINCETCHGPSEEHVRVCREAAKRDEVPEDPKIVRVKYFTPDQHNSACATCHAKGSALTASYPPGEDFFQHFNLITLESPDYYPDGRDLGENYTMTSWFQSQCASNSDLHCVSCHTSSGRYRFKNHDNDACAACHSDKANGFTAHSHHKSQDSLTCISCHMPTTEFARMTRSDHSMRPPMPAATLKFGSPNACNICHTDKDAQWANSKVTEWHGKYQDKTLAVAELIQQGRGGNFKQIKEMLALISNPEEDLIFRNSMIRILRDYPGAEKEEYFLNTIEDESPLIRASTADALQFTINDNSRKALLKSARDEYRVVRTSASMSLAHFPETMFTPAELKIVENNYKEYEEFLMTRPDSWSSYYNLGNFYHGRQLYREAVTNFDKAAELDKEEITPLVNASIVYSAIGDFSTAEQKLRKALELDPDNPASNFNIGLLLAQLQRYDEAELHLKNALNNDTSFAAAAYNLAIVSSTTNPDNVLKYGQKAYELEPENPKYGYTFGYYLYQHEQIPKTISVLKGVIKEHPEYIDAYLFLGEIYEKEGNFSEAIKLYESATMVASIPQEYRNNIRMKANSLRQSLN